MHDDVTIVVTTFNGREDLCGRAVASAAQQARVIVTHGQHRGPDHAYADWWEGVYRARTPYVAILHDDDWYEPTFVERCRAELDDRTAWVATDGTIHFPDGTTRPNLDLLADRAMARSDAEQFLDRVALSPACILMRRDDALNSILVGGIPGVPRRAVVAGPDLLYAMIPLAGQPRRAVLLRDRLVNFGAHAGSCTYVAMQDPTKRAALEACYRDARAFYRKVRSC